MRIVVAHAAADRWCGMYGLQISSRYDLVSYGREMCSLLAQTWGHRMQCYFDLFNDSDDNPAASEVECCDANASKTAGFVPRMVAVALSWSECGRRAFYCMQSACKPHLG